MIFLDWLLRFHPIIIILLQSRSTWTPEAWVRRKLWLCVSQVSVALPAPIVTWSHARGQELSSNVHLTLRRKYLVFRHTGHCTALPWVILHAFTLIRTQTTNRQLNRAQITSENAVCLDVRCLMEWRKARVCRYLSTVNLAVSHYLHDQDCQSYIACVQISWELSGNPRHNSWINLHSPAWRAETLESSQSSAERNKQWSVSDIQDWISIFY